MTIIQEQAIQLIQQLPDDKIQAIITLATDEIKLMRLEKSEKLSKKKKAICLRVLFHGQLDYHVFG